MYALLRPLLFALPPHAAHALGALALAPLEWIGPLRSLVRPKLDPRLESTVLGLTFPSPVGLAGGFDKDARRPRALAALGFGFLELGTVTALAQTPNPAPNLFRLPADRALINRLGFPNEGAAAVADRVRARRDGIKVPVGLSIGKSRDVPITDVDAVLADYRDSFMEVRSVSDFVVVNVSSPNTKDLRAMQGAELARLLLGELVKTNEQMAHGRAGRAVPILIKVAPDLSDADLEALLAVVEETKLDGVVATNTTIRRDGLATPAAEVEAMGAGGLSGPPVRARALEVVRRVRDRLGAKVAIVGVGGVESGEDAVALLRAGADLVQLYTGFIYGGPRTALRVAREALAIANREGAHALSELVRR